MNQTSLLSEEITQLSENGLSTTVRERFWEHLHNHVFTAKRNMIGFQNNQDLQPSLNVQQYLNVHINNGGDPFMSSMCSSNTKVVERALLDYFAKLWYINQRTAPSTSDEEQDREYWGYIVPMGCTEANIYAMYNARDYLSGTPLLHVNANNNICSTNEAVTGHNENNFHPVVFYSEQTHHCFDKATHLLNLDIFYKVGSGKFPCPLNYPHDYPQGYQQEFLDEHGWPYYVPVNQNGDMHVPSLVKLISCFASKGYPPIVVFTCGTGCIGNYENPKFMIEQIIPILKKNNLYERKVYHSPKDPTHFDVRRGYWFHIDGALGAAHLPFLEMAINQGKVGNIFPNGFPVFDFRIPEVMSISMSFHKWLGCPFPGGIYMTRKINMLRPLSNLQYGSILDTTLSGSRNAHISLMIWDLLSQKSYDDLIDQAVRGEEIANSTMKKLQELQKEVGDLFLHRSPGSLMITFKKPKNEEILNKYSLPLFTIYWKNQKGILERKSCSHLCFMTHVDGRLVENFIHDFKELAIFS